MDGECVWDYTGREEAGGGERLVKYKYGASQESLSPAIQNALASTCYIVPAYYSHAPA